MDEFLRDVEEKGYIDLNRFERGSWPWNKLALETPGTYPLVYPNFQQTEYTDDFIGELWNVLARYNAKVVIWERQYYVPSRFDPDDIEFAQTCINNDPDDRKNAGV